MKTKLIVLALCSALSFNAASAESSGSIGLGYASDYYFRGAELSAEAAQLTLGAEAKLGSVNLEAGVFSNQATGGNANTNILDLGASRTFADDLVSLYGGLKNIDIEGADSRLDVVVSAGLSTVLSPTLTVARDTDDNLWTYELGVSHTFVTELADIKLCGLAGSTDLTSSTERDYVGAGLCVSKSFGSVKPYAGVKLIKPEGADRDTIFGAGVTFNF